MIENENIENKNTGSENKAVVSSASASTPAVMKKVFGIFMVLIYFGMGGLTIGGFFDILFGSWHWMKWALGGLFIVYGVWRAYRYFTGRD